MTRAEHMAWAKDRALAELEFGRKDSAIASMLSDLGKHPETARSVMVGGMLVLTLHTPADVKKWIEGFD